MTKKKISILFIFPFIIWLMQMGLLIYTGSEMERKDIYTYIVLVMCLVFFEILAIASNAMDNDIYEEEEI